MTLVVPLKGPLSPLGQPQGQFSKFWTEEQGKVREQWRGAVLEGQGERRSH